MKYCTCHSPDFVLLFRYLEEIYYDLCSRHCKQFPNWCKRCVEWDQEFFFCVYVCVCARAQMPVKCLISRNHHMHKIKPMGKSLHTAGLGKFITCNRKESFQGSAETILWNSYYLIRHPRTVLQSLVTLSAPLMRMDKAEERAAIWQLAQKEEQRSLLPHGIEITSMPGATLENKWKNNRSLHVAMELFSLGFRHAVKYGPSLCPCFRQS